MHMLVLLRIASPLLLWGGACRAGDAVTLYYNERPPYLVGAPDGAVSGLTATPAARAFHAAGMDVTWVKTPINRQLALLREGGPRCTVGWFKNPERERFARFSRPIYRDLPTVALTRSDFSIRQKQPLESALATPGIRVLVKENYSYGGYIDNILLRVHPAVTKTSAESVNMIAMIDARRADLMFVAEEEAQYLIGLSGLSQQGFSVVRFADMPGGESRHIMCSMDLPEQWMRRLDREIQVPER
ncbi:transporter substrate-binding domain-containing protein [Janthinobacterium sp. hw3]|uniref:Transporter substrate-binding domain-containing protein n=2 Tax=Janthinobacterium fluminis TaxID=2987524 RepID=A0ABT5JX47_9BURK|nr:transporter substrate-binding domain-containing protein [Janthinobacterium fluminis]